MTEIWEDDPEVHAELARQALAAAMAEIERRGGIPAAIERANWELRLQEAIRDGLEVAGLEAVHNAVDAIAALAVDRKSGAKREPIPDRVIKAAKRYVRASIAGTRLPTQSEMAQTAGMSPPGFGKQWWNGARQSELLAAAIAAHMADGDADRAKERERRRQEEFEHILRASKDNTK
jgi:hypothetical protein